jgi:hypothetical protein
LKGLIKTWENDYAIIAEDTRARTMKPAMYKLIESYAETITVNVAYK